MLAFLQLLLKRNFTGCVLLSAASAKIEVLLWMHLCPAVADRPWSITGKPWWPIGIVTGIVVTLIPMISHNHLTVVRPHILALIALDLAVTHAAIHPIIVIVGSVIGPIVAVAHAATSEHISWGHRTRIRIGILKTYSNNQIEVQFPKYETHSHRIETVVVPLSQRELNKKPNLKLNWENKQNVVACVGDAPAWMDTISFCSRNIAEPCSPTSWPNPMAVRNHNMRIYQMNVSCPDTVSICRSSVSTRFGLYLFPCLNLVESLHRIIKCEQFKSIVNAQLNERLVQSNIKCNENDPERSNICPSKRCQNRITSLPNAANRKYFIYEINQWSLQ